MAIINWSPNLQVGVQKIDRQHRKIVCLINDMHMAMATGQTEKAVGPMLDGLKAYTVDHFATEEGYMEQFGYPDFENHKAVHQKFIGKVLEYEAALKGGSSSAANMKIMNFLISWVGQHILNHDKAFGPFFNQNGLN